MSSSGLPPHWSLHFSKSQQKSYFFNSRTNERLWRDDDLPHGWAFEWVDGAKMYFALADRNARTKVKPGPSSVPKAVSPPTAAATAPLSTASASSSTGGSRASSHDTIATTAVPPSALAPSASDATTHAAGAAVTSVSRASSAPAASQRQGAGKSESVAPSGSQDKGKGTAKGVAKGKKPSLLSGLLGNISSRSSAQRQTKKRDLGDSAAKREAQRRERARNQTFQDSVRAKLRDFIAAADSTELPFEPLGEGAEEQFLYRFLICEVVDEFEGQLVSMSQGDDAERHVVVYKQGHVPEEVQQEAELPPIPAAASAAPRRQERYGVETKVDKASLATLNTVKRDRRSMEQIQQDMKSAKKARIS